MAHARLFSPSGAEGWFACAGRSVMEAPFPNEGNEDSFNGSARHLVCGDALQQKLEALDYVGREIVFWKHPESDSEGECFRDELGENPECDIVKTVEYKDDWVEEDQGYIDYCRTAAGDQPFEVETQVDFSDYTGVKDDSFGTLDFSCLRPLVHGGHELVVVDRKTGRIHVGAERNKQLMIYALGRYQELSLIYDIQRVRLVVYQREPLEWDCSIEELLEFGEEVRAAATRVLLATKYGPAEGDIGAWQRLYLNPEPTEQACAYCRAMAVCPSMQAKVQRELHTSLDDFEVIEQQAQSTWNSVDLATAFAAVPLIEDWCEAVRAEVRRRTLNGEMPGYKPVLGRQGNRVWRDAEAVERYMKKTLKLKNEVMYSMKLVSPTAAEKLVKDKVIGPHQWKRLGDQVTRAAPSISIVPESDKRDAYRPLEASAADDFPTLPAEPGASS